MHIRQATLNDLDELAPLFDSYRRFYGCAEDLATARQFLSERIIQQQSVIFISHNDHNRAVGFAQLYPSFSSISAARVFILNDLYVAPDCRSKGVGTALLRHAASYARSSSAIRLQLSTAVSNIEAQSLYEREGWQRDTSYYAYQLEL